MVRLCVGCSRNVECLTHCLNLFIYFADNYKMKAYKFFPIFDDVFHLFIAITDKEVIPTTSRKKNYFVLSFITSLALDN